MPLCVRSDFIRYQSLMLMKLQLYSHDDDDDDFFREAIPLFTPLRPVSFIFGLIISVCDNVYRICKGERKRNSLL